MILCSFPSFRIPIGELDDPDVLLVVGRDDVHAGGGAPRRDDDDLRVARPAVDVVVEPQRHASGPRSTQVSATPAVETGGDG